MRNFWRAIRLALRHRLTILGVLLSSTMMALFWGANIGVVYPFIEVVFQGDSMNDWVENQLEETENQQEEIRLAIRELELKRAAVNDPATRSRLERELGFQQSRLEAEEKAHHIASRLQPWIDRYLPHDAFRTLTLIVVFILVGTVTKDLFLIGNMVLVGRLGQITTMELRKNFYRHNLQMELGAFGRGRTGALMSRFSNDIGAICGGVTLVFGQTLREPLKMAVCLMGAALVSWRLLLFSLTITPIALAVMYVLSKSIRRANRRTLEEMARFFNRLSESLSGIQVVLLFTMERFERRRFHQRTKQLYRKAMKQVWYSSLARMNNEVFGVGVICLAVLAGGYLVLSQETHLLGVRMTDRPLSLGAMMVFYAFLAGVSDPARKLANVYSLLQNAAAAADRLYPILDQVPTIRDPVEPQVLPTKRRDLIFDNVDFHYEASKPVLRKVDLRIGHGESLAIVGPNGCGKTTLVNLLPRLYDPVNGAVRLGGIDVRDFRLRDLRRQIGVVNQHPVLFDGSIRDNIRYGSLQATNSEIMDAANRARVDHFIHALDNGYDTEVGERGSRLSGGQRQRIALARAILRDPSILILDEATSQIDPESERLIHHALKDFIRGRTTLLITHRMSTLKLADRILVLDQGVAVDVGTHEQLLQRCDLYRRLYQVDFRQTA